MCGFYANGSLDREGTFSYLGFCEFVAKKNQKKTNQFTLQVPYKLV